jgi:hypothetical protein
VRIRLVQQQRRRCSLLGVGAGARLQQQLKRQLQQALMISRKQQQLTPAMLRWLVLALSQQSRQQQQRTQRVQLSARPARDEGLPHLVQSATSASGLQLAMMLRRKRPRKLVQQQKQRQQQRRRLAVASLLGSAAAGLAA